MRNQYEKQEKVLWYAQIMIFLGALATWFNHMDMHTFYTINIILSVISIISLTLDRFYFSEKIGQKVHNCIWITSDLYVTTGNFVCGNIKDRSDHARRDKDDLGINTSIEPSLEDEIHRLP